MDSYKHSHLDHPAHGSLAAESRYGRSTFGDHPDAIAAAPNEYPAPSADGHPDPSTNGYPDSSTNRYPNSSANRHPDPSAYGHARLSIPNEPISNAAGTQPDTPVAYSNPHEYRQPTRTDPDTRKGPLAHADSAAGSAGNRRVPAGRRIPDRVAVCPPVVRIDRMVILRNNVSIED